MNMDIQKETSWLLKEKYSGEPSAKFYKDVERLKAGEPVAYVIGFSEFLGCRIDLSKKPLIPRVETEYWVGEAIKEINGGRVLDIFAGSGCIGIALLKNNKKVLCDISDFSEDCLKQIRINLKINKIDKKRYKVIRSDIFRSINKKYDFILANPPYIPKTRKNKLPKSVINFEPKQALFGGTDGLYFIRKFLKEARNYLQPASTEASARGPKIFMEFDSAQKKEIEKLIKKFGYKNLEFHRDQFGKWRWVAIS